MTYFNIPLCIISVICILTILLVGRKRPDVVINFFMRIGLCFVAIYFLNDAFLQKGFPLCIAMNAVTFLTCGMLGFPGLFLLYGIELWKIFVGF